MGDEELQKIRGNGISMIFQDPLSALHPFYKVGKQLIEAIQIHQDLEHRRPPAPTRSTCSSSSASPTPSGGSASTRTSSPAGCGSA